MWPFTQPKLRTHTEPRALPIGAIVAPSAPRVRMVYHDGEKFPGGWGATDVLVPDYWTLRQRSADLFKRNIYARGLIRTLITNEIATGLYLEATPEEKILGRAEESLADWSEDVENRFALWAKDPYLCDYRRRESFGALQATARREALVVGDVLVVLRQDPVYRSPKVQLINGASVRTPAEKPRNGNEIKHGVELDSFGRHVAFWVTQDDGTSKRLPAFGEKSGRRLAWLLYGTDNRMDDVRGEPILSICLQSLKEIDRYRDSAVRKAVLNSFLAMYVTKTQDKMSTRPLTGSGGTIRRGSELATDTHGEARAFRAAEQIPGYVIEELQQGEEPKGFPSTGTDEKFGDFEQTILFPFAWSNQIPPEVLLKAFRNNYSASQAAINEFKIYLNVARTTFAENFCEPIYGEWLPAEVLAQRIDAPGLLEAWRDLKRFVEVGAWLACDWSGNIKPAVDLSKLTKGYNEMLEMGVTTRARVCRELSGQRYSKVVKQLARENVQLVEANKPLAELEASTKPAPAPPPKGNPEDENIDDEPTDREDDPEEGRSAIRSLAVA